MDSEEFRYFGKQMIDFTADYLDNIRSRPVRGDVTPGYVKELIPDGAPLDPESFQNVMDDIEPVIMPGVTHWHHPNFYAFFPTGNSYPSLLADILSSTLGVIGFSWESSPACTDLEVVMMDWLAKAMGMPEHFLSTSGLGGGVIHQAASEAALFTTTVARNLAMKKSSKAQNMNQLVMYTSKLANSVVERASLFAGVTIRQLDYDSNYSLRGDTLAEAIETDRSQGLVPFYVCCTLGTTACCSFDNLKELGEVCQREGLWLHVDAAYAGSALICEETRHLMLGIELCDSFNFNPHKWLQIHFDCSALWVKDKRLFEDAFNVDPVYLQHQNQEQAVDFRHWQIPLGRRFRSLKIWFTLRCFGITGLQKFIRQCINLAEYFANSISSSDHFELFCPNSMGLVCFRAKSSNEVNKQLLKKVNNGREIYLTPAEIDGTYFLRLVICSPRTTKEDLDRAFQLICKALLSL